MSETHGTSGGHHAHESPAGAEPKTPMWLPALGAILFLTVGLLWSIMPSSTPDADAARADGDAGAPARR